VPYRLASTEMQGWGDRNFRNRYCQDFIMTSDATHSSEMGTENKVIIHPDENRGTNLKKEGNLKNGVKWE